jgi:hypothetical protein
MKAIHDLRRLDRLLAVAWGDRVLRQYKSFENVSMRLAARPPALR